MTVTHTELPPEEQKEPAPYGAYIYGMFMEGARWDKADGAIAGCVGVEMALVGPSAPAAARKHFLEELETGSAIDELADFFHVAIDLPGCAPHTSFFCHVASRRHCSPFRRARR